MDIVLFSRILLRRKWLILVTSLGCAILTFFLAKRNSSTYKSVAQLATGITMKEEVSLNDNKTNRDDIKNKFSNLSEFLNSKDILTMLSYRLVFHELEEKKPFRPKQVEKLRQAYSDQEIEAARQALHIKYDHFEGLSGLVVEDLKLKKIIKIVSYEYPVLEKLLDINRVVETDFVEIKTVTENRFLSAFLVNSYCEEAIRNNVHSQSKKSQSSLDFFRDLVAQKKKILDDRMDSLKLYKDQINVVDHGLQTQSKLDQISALETQRNEAIKNVNGLKQVLAHINAKMGVSSDPEVLDNTFLNNKIYQLKSKINDLNERYISNGSKDKALVDSLKIVRKQLNVYVGKLNNEVQKANPKDELAIKKMNAEIDLEQAKSNLSSIESSIYGLRSNLSGHTTSGNNLADLEMSIQVAREEYLQVLDKFNAAQNVALDSGMALRQIEVGEPADEPEPSKVLVLTIVSFIFSASMFIVFFFVREYIDKSLKTPTIFKNRLPFHMIGIVNLLNDKNIHVPQIFADKSKSIEHDKFRQYMRKIRVEVEGLGARSILFSSLKEGEGKSMVLFSVAYSISLIGKKVLIIDTNFKNNTLTKLLSAPRDLENIPTSIFPARQIFDATIHESETDDKDEVSTSLSPQEKTYDFIHKTPYHNIFIIGCQGSELSPSELLQGKNFNELLAELKISFDYIFMEGPSLNEYSDTKELIDFADKVITVMAADTSISQIDMLSIDYLTEMKDKHAGSILNMVDINNLHE